jgi:hypothetical protein
MARYHQLLSLSGKLKVDRTIYRPASWWDIFKSPLLIMKVTQLPPLEYVSRTRYYDACGDKMARTELLAGAAYIARLIVNPLCERDHAADYFVKVNDVYVPSRKLTLGRIAVTPLTPDGTHMDEAKTTVFAIHDDGMLSSPHRLFSRIEYEKGYLLDNYSELDRDLAEHLTLDRPRNPVPV